MEHSTASALFSEFALQPDLAHTAANLVCVVVGGFAQRFEPTTQIEDVSIAILPVVERGKVFLDRLDVRHLDLTCDASLSRLAQRAQLRFSSRHPRGL